MKLDGWHVLALVVAMLFVLALAAVAWRAPGASGLWPVVITGGGALLGIIGGFFRGAQLTAAARFNQRND